jgi:20S proteasome subunit alpha 4
MASDAFPAPLFKLLVFPRRLSVFKLLVPSDLKLGAGCLIVIIDSTKMSGYDRALTVFSPSGQLFQVEYAMQAVAKGAAIVALKGENVVVLGAERRAAAKLQDARTMKKIVKIDDNIVAAFAGLTADARVLINQARVQAQSHRLTFEDAPSVEFIAKWIAQLQQRYTQMGGVRPYGVTSLIAGFDQDGTPNLFQTDPSGVMSAWKASAAGKNDKFVREFLEKNYSPALSREATIKLTLKALLEVVDSGEGNIEVVVLTADRSPETMKDEDITALVKQIEAEKEAESEKKKTTTTTTTSSAS